MTATLPKLILAAGGLFGTSALLPAATILYGPLSYFSEADSPFFPGIEAGTIYLENFEDQQLNTPRVGIYPGPGMNGNTARALFPSAVHGTIWSVDGDDGIVDGDGFLGDTWITPSDLVGFEFQPDILGRYPTFVGLVVTDVDDPDFTVDFAFNEPGGRNVISDGEFDPKEWRPPGGAPGGDPRLHRFVGVYHEEGIRSLIVANVDQVDHLQYGYAIPEPGLAALAAAGLLAWCGRRRRHCSCRTNQTRI